MIAASPKVAARTQEIAECRHKLTKAWPDAWRGMVRPWGMHGPDALWLMYSANYLLRTGGVRWAIDPVTLRNTVPEAAPTSVDDLAPLEFILLTHNHADHVDRALLQQLAAVDSIRWLVPRHMLSLVESCGVRGARITVPEPMQPLTLGPLRITVFDGLHWQYPGRWGVGKPVAGIDAAACLVEWSDRRILFPGDTRTYDAAALPPVGPIDALFAHVWLGRGAAMEPDPPLLDAMCQFVAHLAPRLRVGLTHLWEFSRVPADLWTPVHAEQVKSRLAKHLPTVDVLIPGFWTEVTL